MRIVNSVPRVLVYAVVGLAALPGAAVAQSAIAGMVTDTTRAVLPGVTVEARSPALIEQVRTVITDDEGRYRITSLRSGTYSVTFTLPGFTTVVREGITLEADFTASVDAQLLVGGVEETLTVTSAVPVVDLRSTNRREVLTREMVELLPSARNYNTLAATLPSVRGAIDVGGSDSMQQGSVTAYGGLGSDFAVEIDGMNVSSVGGGGTGSTPGMYYNTGATQEFVYQISAGNADTQTGGVKVNMIPKVGGNRFSGQGLLILSNGALQSHNLTDAVRAAGVTAPAGLDRLFDYNGEFGGPVLRDRLWFFSSARYWAFNNKVLNLLRPDGSQVVDTNLLWALSNRVTMQATPKNKIAVALEYASKERDYQFIELGDRAIEAANRQKTSPYIVQAKWTAPVSSRLLLEGGLSVLDRVRDLVYQSTVRRPSATDPYGDIAKFDLIRNWRWNNFSGGIGGQAQGGEFRSADTKYHAMTSLSYVTGSHALKVGYQLSWVHNYLDDGTISDNGSITQQYRNGVPDSVSVRNTPVVPILNLNADLGIYVQDSWVVNRLTLNPGLRFEYLHSEIPAQFAPAGRFVPARSFAKIENLPNWKDLAPRFGASYDVSGNGRTAVKGSAGRFMQQEAVGFAARYNPMENSVDSRTWQDLNGDDIAQDSELGPPTNLAFGVRRNRNPDPDIERPYQILYSLGTQHELRRGVGLAVTYNRREFHGNIWTDNLATSHADYTLLTTPDPRGTGQVLPVYNLSRAKFGLIDELDTNSTNKQAYNGVDLTFNARFPKGGLLSGGTSTGRLRGVTCEVDNPNALRFCDQTAYDIPFRTSFKLSGSYPLLYGFRVSGVFQSLPGQEISINYSVNSRIVPGLTVPTLNIRLNEPGSEFLSRVNQLDLGIAKTFRARGLRIAPKIDLFNALNASPVLSEVTTFGSALGQPRGILPARLLRLTAQVDF